MNEIYAIYTDEGGYPLEPEIARERGLVKGEKYIVNHADVGRSFTNVFLEGFKGSFNSTMFDFIDEDGNEVDIVEEYYYTYEEQYGEK